MYAPQYYASILGSPSGVLPSSSTKSRVYDTACIERGSPCIDGDAGAGLEAVGLTGGVAAVEGIEEGGGRQLCGWLI